MRTISLVPPADNLSHPLRRRWLGTPAYWAMQAGGWGLLGASMVVSTLCSVPPPKSTRDDLAITAIGLLFGLLVTHLLRVLILALRHRRPSVLRLTAWMVPACFVGAAAIFNPVVALCVAYSKGPDDEVMQMTVGSYLSTVLLGALLIGSWTVFYFAYHDRHRYRQATIERLRLDAAVKEAELRALRSQVNPHFLFNSLNCLRALIPRDLHRPREAITLLADLLRSSLTLGQCHLVPLSQELETTENYLALEQLRFESRLRIHRRILPETLHRPVPPFVVQTLIENAIKFGVSRFEQGSDVLLEAHIAEDDSLVLSVENQGRLDPAASGTGVGLGNARARLTLLFGPSASLTLSQVSDRVVARVTIPPKPLPLSP